MAETLTVGQAYLISWVQGWQGIGEKYNWPNVGAEPKFMDLFVVSFNSDAYINVIKEVTNVSVAAGGRYNWRVSIPEDIVRQEQNFTFKFVNAQDPPNYIKAGGAYVVSPSRGFKVALAANAASASSSRTAPASSSTASPTSSPTATSTQIPANNDNNNNKKKKSSKTPIGAIVGGVLGGLAILALAVIAWLLWKRSQKKAAAAQAAVSQEPYGTASHGPYGNAPPYVPEMANTETSMHSTAPTTKYAQTAGAPHELPANHAPVEADAGFRGYR